MDKNKVYKQSRISNLMIKKMVKKRENYKYFYCLDYSVYHHNFSTIKNSLNTNRVLLTSLKLPINLNRKL